MEFRLEGFNEVYRLPSESSSSIYTNFTNQVPEEGLWRRSVSVGGRSEILRELEKEIIREEILAERRRILEAEVRRELIMEREMMAMQSRLGYVSPFMLPPPHSHHNFKSEVLHGEYGSLDVVRPLQQRPQSPEKNSTEKPYGSTSSGAKRKRRRPPSPAVGCSSEVCYSPKKKDNELSCALCKVSTTCKLDLEDHLAGKKHQAKAAGLEKGKRHLKKLHKSGRKSRGKSGAKVKAFVRNLRIV